ncbi:MAG: hypothetical protein ABR555_09495 [Pyrinomonadaceae bacterium]
MVELTELTKQRVAELFAAADVQEAERLLVRECADNLPLLGKTATSASLERIRFAVLRLSDGQISRLTESIAIAKRDWRDVLVWAGFGNDLQAHERWRPRRLTDDTVNAWLAGSHPDEVAFSFQDHVELVFGPHCGDQGFIINLVALEPEPCYLVELKSGAQVKEYERRLKRP